MESIKKVSFFLLELLPKNCGCFGHSLFFFGDILARMVPDPVPRSASKGIKKAF